MLESLLKLLMAEKNALGLQMLRETVLPILMQRQIHGGRLTWDLKNTSEELSPQTELTAVARDLPTTKLELETILRLGKILLVQELTMELKLSTAISREDTYLLLLKEQVKF